MACQCQFWSKYLGKQQDCDSCRGKSPDVRMREFYDLLCSCANLLDEGGSPHKADDLRKWAAAIPLWFKP